MLIYSLVLLILVSDIVMKDAPKQEYSLDQINMTEWLWSKFVEHDWLFYNTEPINLSNWENFPPFGKRQLWLQFIRKEISLQLGSPSLPCRDSKGLSKYKFGNVQLLRFVIAKFFWSCSNQNSVIFIWSCELASYKIIFLILITGGTILASWYTLVWCFMKRWRKKFVWFKLYPIV